MLTDNEFAADGQRRRHNYNRDGDGQCDRGRAEHMPGAGVHGGSAGPHPQQNRRELPSSSETVACRHVRVPPARHMRPSYKLHAARAPAPRVVAPPNGFCRQTWTAGTPPPSSPAGAKSARIFFHEKKRFKLTFDTTGVPREISSSTRFIFFKRHRERTSSLTRDRRNLTTTVIVFLIRRRRNIQTHRYY